jgi:hypothetical protein
MAIIGSMTTGAGILTSLILPQSPQYLIIDNSYGGTFDLTNLDVSINGASTISLIGADDIDSVAQIKSHESAADNYLSMAIELADGQINASTLIRLTNEGTNTNTIYGVSKQVGTAPYRISQYTLNQTSNQVFQDFDYLLINSSPTNIDSVEIQWLNGFKNRYAPQELSVLFRNMYASMGSSQFSTAKDVAWINNEDGLIANCTVFSNSSGSVTVTVGRI